MTHIRRLLDDIRTLDAPDVHTSEESFRFTIEGGSLSAPQAQSLAQIGKDLEENFPDLVPTLLIDDDAADCGTLAEPEDFLGLPWRLVLPKRNLSAHLSARTAEETLFFFSEQGLVSWLEGMDPFIKASTFDPNFDGPVTIRVGDLKAAFGGPSLWVLPLDEPAHQQEMIRLLPTHDEVSSIVHISSSGPNVRVSPRGWALTWGNLDAPAAQPLLRLGCLILGSSLSSDLKHIDGAITSTIRGAKQYSLPLWSTNTDLPWRNLHQRLVSAVAWVYSERPETRLHLLMDRLTLDINPGEFLLASLHRHLDLALRQAEDSYRFVILDRKDAYYKEMRELMKDMKAQSDHYASKTRDVVNALLRDFLGVLVFLAFSFVGKFDHNNLHSLLISQELTIFLRFLAGYLALSFILQIVAHIRDDCLTHGEAEKWLDVLRNYTSSQDKCQNFMRPIDARRRSLHQAMAISGLLYGVLTAAVWFLPRIVQSMLT